MRVKGLIERIGKSSVTIKVSPDWDYSNDEQEWYPRRSTVTMTLRIEPTLIDKLIASYKDLLIFKIKEGKITHIQKVKPPPPSPTDMDLLLTGKPKSLRDNLRTVIDTLQELEGKQVYVPKAELIAKLGEKEIPPEEADKLIRHLELEGIIYEPKNGYYRKT
jgi:hypothetical protein